MNAITRATAAVFLVLVVLIAPSAAQQKRQTTPKPVTKPVVTTTPAPTFETLLPADSYIIYGELRGAGQFIRSSALTDVLEPVLKLSGPPKEFRTLAKWLNAHSEELMTSRLLLATWPSSGAKEVPQTIVAIEFASAEEAAKFAGTLNAFLPTVLPPPAPESSAKTLDGTSEKQATPATPNFHLQRMGSLIVITPKPWTMKQLKPAGSKLLAEDANFRAARNRFNSEPIFAYVDVKAIEREDQERRKRVEEAREQAEQVQGEKAEAEAEPEKADEPKGSEMVPEQHFELVGTVEPEPPKETATPDPLSGALSALAASFSAGESDWPDGVGLALSYEGESFDLRALFINQPGEKADVVPFVPMLIAGAAFTPESPNIFPADSEMLVTMSLDLPQIYTAMSKPRPKDQIITSKGNVVNVKEVEHDSPFAAIEQRLKIKIKDDLLPLLGSEIALRLPMKDMNILGLSGIAASRPAVIDQQSTSAGPVLAIAIKDRDAVRALMPKLIDNLGFKGASSLAQTERREDTEIVSFANVFSYAFVGNFLVLSADPATTRHVVDSYLKHETLSGESQFRNSTRWQPRPLQGQIYISPSLMESYKDWAEQPNTRVSDQVRAFLTRASSVAQPITYSLSNEGFGPLHEVHIPKNLVLMAVAGISGELNPTPTAMNERMTIGLMYTIASAEQRYRTTNGNGSCGTLEQLIAADLVSKEMVDNSGYRIDVTAVGDKFEVSAVPVEYGKSGKLSLFIDHTGVLRGGDRQGASVSASDPPLQ